MNFEVSENSYDDNGAMHMEEDENPHEYASDHPTNEYAPEVTTTESNAGIYVAVVCVVLAIIVLFVVR